MTFDDTLAALLDLVGQRVEVAIESPAGGMVAHFTGELAHGHDLTARDDDIAADVLQPSATARPGSSSTLVPSPAQSAASTAP